MVDLKIGKILYFAYMDQVLEYEVCSILTMRELQTAELILKTSGYVGKSQISVIQYTSSNCLYNKDNSNEKFFENKKDCLKRYYEEIKSIIWKNILDKRCELDDLEKQLENYEILEKKLKK